MDQCIEKALELHRESLMKADDKLNVNGPPRLDGIWCQDANGWFRVDV